MKSGIDNAFLRILLMAGSLLGPSFQLRAQEQPPRIAAQQTAAGARRARDPRILSQAFFVHGADLLDQQRACEGLALLALAVRLDTNNITALTRLYSALVYGNYWRPISQPLTHGGDINSATFSPDGRYVVTTSGQDSPERGGLSVVDVSDPAVPKLVGVVPTTRDALSVALAGDYAFVATGYSGVQVCGIRRPAKPREAGQIDCGGVASEVVIDQNTAFVFVKGAGLLSYDITKATKPRFLERLRLMDEVGQAVLRDARLYLAQGVWGLGVVRVASEKAHVEQH